VTRKHIMRSGFNPSDNIRALWRATMDVERAMEIGDQMEPYAESYSDSLVYESDNLILL